MKLLLMILSRFFRPIVGLILLLSVAYLIFDLLRSGTDTVAMEKWLQKTGDAELLRLYQETKDAKARKALGVSLRVYEKRYGKGAWLSHFHDDSKWGVCYADIAKIVLGLTDARERDAFLDAHADAYDACVQAGELDTAYRYATLLSELKEKGGKNWHVVSQNPFAASVYDQVGANPELWNWYLDNVTWCDKFLVTCSPNDGASLKDVIMELKAQKRLYQAFANEMENKTEDEKRDLVDGDEDCDMDDAVYALGLGFMSRYGNILSSLVVAGVPVIESMAVVANSLDAFDYETPEGQRAAGEYLAWLYRNHPILWQNAAYDTGAHVVWLSRQVPIQWAEQIVGRFGQEHLATFLYDNYRDDNDPRLLSVAAETIYKCQEPGWATLQKYRHEVKFKEFLLDKRIGYRVVPYILRFGEEKAFTDMWNDARWVDECFDKDGNLKRKDVSWYEMSPVGGDLGTVLKKWCQGRPCSTEEIGWAAFDTVDMVAMAFSLGMSKAATSTAKAGGKAAAKRIGRQTEKKLLKNQV